jgi:hypothetical protein
MIDIIKSPKAKRETSDPALPEVEDAKKRVAGLK